MQKICYMCQEEYSDNTKRKTGKTCSKKCAILLSVMTRKNNGTYIRTEEQNKRMIASIKRIRANGGMKLSKTGIENIRKAAKQRGGDPMFGEKMKGTHMKKHGVHHWTQTEKGRKRLSEIHTGKYVPPERIKALTQAAMKSISMHSRSKKGIREDLKCFFRSTWEANYARYLNYIGVKWKYEPITYNLANNKTYTPDFLLEDGTIVEIKGWLTKQGKEKLNAFTKEYPNVTVIIVTRKEYNEIKKNYQFEIEKWEI